MHQLLKILSIEFSSKSRFDNQVMISKLGGNQNLKKIGVQVNLPTPMNASKLWQTVFSHNDFSLEEIVIEGVSMKSLYGFSSPLD